jgi:molecular chaperone GrpE
MKEAKEQAKKQAQETENNSMGIDINTDENQSGTTHLNEPVANEPEIEKIKAELEEMKDRFLRKVAEFDNFKKRNTKERMELIQTAGREVIIDLLEVLDDCTRAEKQIAATDDVNQLKEGVMLVFTKLKNILTAKGLKAMETVNQEFNPDLHEAITEIPAPSEEMKGKVIDEIEKGYYLNDKIIRYAKVVVGK